MFVAIFIVYVLTNEPFVKIIILQSLVSIIQHTAKHLLKIHSLRLKCFDL